MERRKYPIHAEEYELYEEVGQGVSACVYKARCIPLNEIVAIKVIDFEKHNSDLCNISREAQTLTLVDHPNVLNAHCSFVNDHTLWIVMPYMAGGSCLHILKSAYPDGFEEAVIATLLREALKGLEYLHQHGHIHRDVKAGNILMDGRGGVKLGDFGVSACLFDSGDRQRTRNTFVGTPCWMAPEVLEQLHGYDFKADIWSFGITALELAHGHAPFSKYPPMKVLLMTLQNAPPSLDYERDKKFSKSFKQMVAMCLVKDPRKRPSSTKLLKHSFFKQARSSDFICRSILEGLPSLGDRIRALKIKEEDMLAQKKMPDGKKEELSQNEYKRGISGWSFNIDDMKAQAALDPDEIVQGKQPSVPSNSLFEFDNLEEKISPTISSTASYSSKEGNDEIMQCKAAFLSSSEETSHTLRGKLMGSDDEILVGSSTDRTSQLDNYLSESCDSEADEKYPNNVRAQCCYERKASASSFASDTADICFGGERANQQCQVSSKGTKLTASGADDGDEKSKGPVVQQKGRFKVTSENLDTDRALPSLLLQKSHTVQGISQLPAASPQQAAETTTTTTTVGDSSCPLHHHLASILQTNILQRDYLLSLMKMVSAGGFPDGGRMGAPPPPPPSDVGEISTLESAHEKEEELLREINDMQSRLVCAQEELQRLRTRGAQVGSSHSEADLR